MDFLSKSYKQHHRKVKSAHRNREINTLHSMDVLCMICNKVKMFIDDLTSKMDTSFWQPRRSYPNHLPLKINAIFTYNNAFAHYVMDHPHEISDFQLDSILSMLKCSQNEIGGITYFCQRCDEMRFIPFRCHSRVCPTCGKRYSELWGRQLMDRFFQRIAPFHDPHH